MSDLVRLNVNMDPETAAALRELAEGRGISYTETLRRAIAVYSYIDREVEDGRRVLTSNQRGREVRELVLL